jgi:hypothetical protein
MMLPRNPALLAMGEPARETLFLEVLKAGFIIWKLAIKIIDRVAQVLRDGLSAVHVPTSQTEYLKLYLMSRDNYHCQLRTSLLEQLDDRAMAWS